MADAQSNILGLLAILQSTLHDRDREYHDVVTMNLFNYPLCVLYPCMPLQQLVKSTVHSATTLLLNEEKALMLGMFLGRMYSISRQCKASLPFTAASISSSPLLLEARAWVLVV